MPQTSSPKSRGETIILGYGKFGRQAMASLQAILGDQATFTVVDKEGKTDGVGQAGFVCGDGVEWLFENLTKSSKIERIIPALPLHLAARWLAVSLSSEGWNLQSLALGDTLLAQLPNVFRLGPSSAVTSHADFLCPDNCPEPELICTHTGQPRPTPIYQLLEDMGPGDLKPLIVRSHQFAPGVGGFFPEDLWNLLDSAKRLSAHRLLIGTACKCHGIVDGMWIQTADIS